MIKILHFIHSLEHGGAQAMRLEIIRALQKTCPDMFSHYVLSIKTGPLLAEFNNINIPVSIIGSNNKYMPRIFLLPKIIYETRRFQPHIVHCLPWIPNIFSRVVLKYFVTNQTVFINDLHGTAHLSSLQNFLDRHTYNLADYWVFPTKYLLEYFAKKWGQIPPSEKFLVLPNFIDTEQFKFNHYNREIFRQKYSLNNDDFIIGTAARLESVKRLDFLLNNFIELKKTISNRSVKLFLAGAGPLEQQLKDIVKSANLESDVIITTIQRFDIHNFFSALDLFVLCSESEGLPLSLLEAAASGLPILLTQNLEHLRSTISYLFQDHIHVFEHTKDFCLITTELINQEARRECSLAKEHSLLASYKSLKIFYSSILK